MGTIGREGSGKKGSREKCIAQFNKLKKEKKVTDFWTFFVPSIRNIKNQSK